VFGCNSWVSVRRRKRDGGGAGAWTCAAIRPILSRVASTRFRACSSLVLLLCAAPAFAADPLNTVRAFCAADGKGMRIDPSTWASLAPLVAWRLEPAWDRIRVIRGYRIGTPVIEGEEVLVAVEYTVVNDVEAGTVRNQARLESHTFRLAADESAGWWRILPPPPPPYLFDSQVDVDALATLLDPDAEHYLSGPALVWRLLHGAGWELPRVGTAELASAGHTMPIEIPSPGDLVFHFDGEEPYSVGLVESAERAVFATLNGGIRRAPFDALAGRVEYRRLRIQPQGTGPAGRTPPAPPPRAGEDDTEATPTSPSSGGGARRTGPQEGEDALDVRFAQDGSVPVTEQERELAGPRHQHTVDPLCAPERSPRQAEGRGHRALVDPPGAKQMTQR
jgi:hypothetical protein